MLRLAALLACLLAVVYAGACGMLYLFQRSLIYFPQAAAVQTALTQVNTGSDGFPVVASVGGASETHAVVYFGGNAEDVTLSLQPLAEAFPGHALYLLHYRGYGGSGGQPSEEALLKDGLALFDQAHQHRRQVTVIGRSLGSGVALQVASQRPASQLVLVTPYDSLQELAARQFRWFPVRWLLRDTFDSGRHVSQVRSPTHLIAAEHDEVIPRDSTEQLYRRFDKGTATLSVVPGTSHNTISQHPMYLLLLSAP